MRRHRRLQLSKKQDKIGGDDGTALERVERVERVEGSQDCPITQSDRRWSFDERGMRRDSRMPSPFGYIRKYDKFTQEDTNTTGHSKEYEQLVYKSAMRKALDSMQQLVMICIMLWLFFGSEFITSISMIGMAIWQPIQKLLNINQEFARYTEQSVDVTVPKLAYIGLNFLCIVVILYKCFRVGWLPTPADWIFVPPVKKALEFSSGSVIR